MKLIGLLIAATMSMLTGTCAADRGYKDEFVPVEIWTQPGDLFIRVRGLAVIPQESSGNWIVGGAPVSGADVSITTSFVPEIDFTYFITKNIAVELIAAVTPHTVKGTGIIKGFGNIGNVWLLPPTLTLQYHFDTGTAFKPYLGAGLNYTVFFGEDSSKNYRNLKLDNSLGFAVQAGLDYKLSGNWFLNVDFKKIWLDTDAKVFSNGLAAPVTARVDVDPIIVGVGIGYKFGGGYVPLK